MTAARLRALAELLGALRREQERDGFKVFCLLSEDRVSFTDVMMIETALKERAERLALSSALPEAATK